MDFAGFQKMSHDNLSMLSLARLRLNSGLAIKAHGDHFHPCFRLSQYRFGDHIEISVLVLSTKHQQFY